MILPVMALAPNLIVKDVCEWFQEIRLTNHDSMAPAGGQRSPRRQSNPLRIAKLLSSWYAEKISVFHYSVVAAALSAFSANRFYR